jgi:hypothetical protein
MDAPSGARRAAWPGTCECGGAYRRDPEINHRVVAAIRGEKRFRDTSVWVTTTRKFVTLQGCVRSATQKEALERLVKRQPDVAIVWNETSVVVTPPVKEKPRTSRVRLDFPTERPPSAIARESRV